MKNVLITGSSSGIGADMALYFAENGYNVGITYNKSEKSATELVEKINRISYAKSFFADVSDNNSCINLTENFIKEFSTVDVLINNAAISEIKPIADMDVSEWDRIISTNLSAQFYLTKALLPYFLKNGGGSIINIASMWGVAGASCEVAYSASKAGVIGFTKALSRELGLSGIRVNSISPGYIDTPMNKSLDDTIKTHFSDNSSLGKVGTPRDVSKVALFLASDNSSFITGQNVVVDGGYL